MPAMHLPHGRLTIKSDYDYKTTIKMLEEAGKNVPKN